MSDFTEKTQPDGISPCSAGFSLEGGRALGVYLLGGVTLEELQTAVTDVVGETDITPGDGRVQRTPMAAHPMWPWLYADSITEIRGIGVTGENQLAGEELEAPTLLDNYADYTNWRFTVEFKSKPYPVSPDSAITFSTVNYYNPDGSGPLSFSCPNEFDRYAWLEYIAKDDNNIAAKNGQMQFITTITSACAPKTCAFSPSMYLPDMYMKLYWYGIPYRYITSPSSYIVQYRGYINQNAMTICGQDFTPGQLLYLHFSAKPYTPPVQGEALWVSGIMTAEKLCNVEMTFLRTDRIGSDLPTPPTNKNFIMGGHNLLPWLTTRQFYYAQSVPKIGCGATPSTPAYYSAPLEALQLDPDVVTSL
jgi:hypothetical protein